MIKLISSSLEKGTTGTGLFGHEKTVPLSMPTWDGRDHGITLELQLQGSFYKVWVLDQILHLPVSQFPYL